MVFSFLLSPSSFLLNSFTLIIYNTKLTMDKKFSLSSTDKKLAGVCGGVAAYMNLDATLVRAAFILLTLFSGIGLIAYLVLWLLGNK
jgi:phage shock protein PspC (stress-responsive transcriptional regulator)